MSWYMWMRCIRARRENVAGDVLYIDHMENEEVTKKMRKCPYCGAETDDNAKFCSSCGKDISVSAADTGSSAFDAGQNNTDIFENKSVSLKKTDPFESKNSGAFSDASADSGSYNSDSYSTQNNNTYSGNPYSTEPNGADFYNAGQSNSGQYNGGVNNGAQYGGPYNNSPYGGAQNGNSQYGSSQYGNTPYNNGQYGGQYNNQQYGGAPYNNQYGGGPYNNAPYGGYGSAYNGSDKAMGIICYLSWIGWIIAICVGSGNQNGYRSPFLTFHLNQSLVLNLFALIGVIPILGWFWAIFVCVCWFIGLISACNGTMKEVPLLGKIRIIQ